MEKMEEWRDIKGYEGYYQVSNEGRIKGMKRTIISSIGIIRRVKESIRKTIKDKNGYLSVQLCKDGKAQCFFIHRLVATAFLPNPNNYPVVNHKDENPSNNFVWVNSDGSVDPERSNLEWCDSSYNNTYGSRIEKVNKKTSKKVLQYSLQGILLKEYQSVSEAARELGFNHQLISACCRGYNDITTAYGYIWKYN